MSVLRPIRSVSYNKDASRRSCCKLQNSLFLEFTSTINVRKMVDVAGNGALRLIFVYVNRPRSRILPVLVSLYRAFLPRDAQVHSAVLRLHVVRLSVCPSVTLMDQDHIGWKSWKLIARSIRPTPLLFVTQRPST